MPDVIIAGSALMDTYIMLDRHAMVGESLIARGMRLVPGGKGLNVAVASSKMGASTSFVGKVGEDQYGKDIEKFLSSCKINMQLYKTKSDSTGMAVIAITDKAESLIMIVYAANMALEPKEVEPVKMNSGDILIGQMEIPFNTTERFFDKGHKAGTTNILNMSPIKEPSRKVIELADIILVNEHELSHFSKKAGSDDKEGILGMMRSLRARSGQIVIATLGERGAIALDGDRVYEVQGRKVNVVDTTGAGDCFLAGFANRLANRSDIHSAMEYGNAAASICVQRMGTGDAMPTAKEVDEVLGSD